MNSFLTKIKFKKIIISREKVMLNVGCGQDYKKSWVNIDNNSDNNIKELDISWDLRKPLPVDDNSVDFIFNEHFLEHLTVEEAIVSLRDFMRVLKEGGVLRIAVPDLNDVVSLYNDKKWKEKAFIKKFNLSFVQTKAEMININFRWWGHKWLYDWEELERRLKDAGCKNFKQCNIHKSSFPELRDLETREESKLIAEIIK